ncbi:hypothetical protein H4582DRAFT_178238 [Lactarius indigo]|nr:hypothetical protein H4582DRAFT_178238 [Lactarius indigo]
MAGPRGPRGVGRPPVVRLLHGTAELEQKIVGNFGRHRHRQRKGRTIRTTTSSREPQLACSMPPTPPPQPPRRISPIRYETLSGGGSGKSWHGKIWGCQMSRVIHSKAASAVIIATGKMCIARASSPCLTLAVCAIEASCNLSPFFFSFDTPPSVFRHNRSR